MDGNKAEFQIIARVYSDFDSKFAIPRQSGLVEELVSELVFEEPFRDPECLRGLEEYSHLWLLWLFSANRSDGWNPTVRPPRLGGNTRMGVFATRSPYRPNPIGLSSVRLLDVVRTHDRGTVLRIGGADLMNGTPVLDIKPYIYSDIHENAAGGFTDRVEKRRAEVECPPALLQRLPEEKRAALLGILAEDPRPAYQDDPEREYGFGFAGKEIRFRVENGRLKVTDIH